MRGTSRFTVRHSLLAPSDWYLSKINFEKLENWPRAWVVRSLASRWRAEAIPPHRSWVPNARTWPLSSAMGVWCGSSTCRQPAPMTMTTTPSLLLSLMPLLIPFTHLVIRPFYQHLTFSRQHFQLNIELNISNSSISPPKFGQNWNFQFQMFKIMVHHCFEWDWNGSEIITETVANLATSNQLFIVTTGWITLLIKPNENVI